MTHCNIADAPKRLPQRKHVSGSDARSVLYFAPHPVWPINSGARLRDYHLARHLAARCEVTFVEMVPAGEEPRHPPAESGFTRVLSFNRERAYGLLKIVRGLAGPIPVTVLNCWSPQTEFRLARALRSHRFDTVQLEGLHLMEYLPTILEGTGWAASGRDAASRSGIVVDWHNVESEIMRRYAQASPNWLNKMAAARTSRLIEQAEERLLETCCVHTVTSERERRKLLARVPGAEIHVIPNGVEVAHYSPGEIRAAASRERHDGGKPSILFVGSMDYRSNIEAVLWFSRVVWPEVARRYPDLQFTIVGRDPPAAVRTLASSRIRVTGTVEDVRPFYASATASVVPLRSGSGTRLKILEAMAAGVPVVSTRLGAEGLAVEHDVDILLADSAQDFVAAINKIVSSAETRSRRTAAALDLVTSRYDWAAIGEKLYRIHSGQCARRRDLAICWS